MRLASFLIPMILMAPAVAKAEPGEAWQVNESAARVSAAGVSVPMAADLVTLVKSGEVTERGSGVDNFAQYASEDNLIQGTAFVYKSAAADTSVASYMTEKAILDRFGPQTHRVAMNAVPAGGVANAALRTLYRDDAHGLVTEAAFVQAGEWMVKLRMTGPAEADMQVAAAMDALLADLRFDDAAAVKPAVARAILPCAEGVTADPSALCVRGSVEVSGARYDMLQPAATAAPVASLMIPLDDAGKVMRFDRVSAGGGYQLTVQQVGRTDTYQTYDQLPSTSTIARLIDSDGASQLSSIAAPHSAGMQ